VSNTDSSAGNLLKTALHPSPECLEPDRLRGARSASEEAHLATCPRCRTNLALMTEFMDSTPSAEEGAAVQWVVRELGRRREESKTSDEPAARRVFRPWWAGLFRHRLAVVATALAVVAGAIYLVPNREPVVRDPAGRTGGYRTEAFKVIQPVGEKKVAPGTFEWEAVQDVVQYDVVLLEVDGTPLWATSVKGTSVAPPRSVLARMVPGKTLRWRVRGRNAAGVVVAETATAEFRVIS
jgi:hypothetical protein